MPKFGRASRKRYETLHYKLQMLMDEAIQIFDFAIICGHRNKRAQEKAFKEGKSTKHYPDSNHNKYPSTAVDVAPWDPSMRNGKGDIDWNNRDRFILLYGIIKGIAHKLKIDIRWGGDFNGDTFMRDQKFIDMPHIELVNPDKDPREAGGQILKIKRPR